MPTGLEEGAALLGLIGFSTALFKACVKGLMILSKARGYGRDTCGMSLMIELELHKLYSWAVEVGLAQNPPSLRIGAEQAILVHKVLEHLKELVFDLEKLRTVHDLHLQEQPDQLLSLEHDDSAFGRLGLKSGEGYHKLALEIFRQRGKPWKALKWVTFDEQKARGLLDSIRSFINDLQQILDDARQAKIMKAVDVILRSAVLNTVSEQDLDMIGSLPQMARVEDRVAAAARFKKQGLLLGVLDTQQPMVPYRPRADSLMTASTRGPSSNPLTPRYSTKNLARTRLHASRLKMDHHTGLKARLLARYDGTPVLLEFRGETGMDKELERDRVGKVSLFLADLDPSFHGLSCLGYVKVFNKFAYVFDVQEVLPISSAQVTFPMAEYRSLRELLDTTASPSLNLRLDFATTLLETLLQLHTSGWLHKELRSDNMLLFRESQNGGEEFLSAELRIMGYAYARADLPFEATEPLESEFEANLYRHPACLRITREPFRRAFDMFSVGCIMIELGLWCSLKKLCEEAHREAIKGIGPIDHMKSRNRFLLLCNDDSSIILSDALRRRLESSAGRRYTSMVRTLMHSMEGDDVLNKEVDSLAVLRTMRDML